MKTGVISRNVHIMWCIHNGIIVLLLLKIICNMSDVYDFPSSVSLCINL